MKFILLTLLFFGLFSCEKVEKINEKPKIIYKLKPAVQDTINKAIIRRVEMLGNEINLEFFITFGNSEEREEDVFILDYCFSSKEEKESKKDGCLKYKNILKNTNRFLKLKDKLIPIIFDKDMNYTDSKNYLITKLGGTRIFVLDQNGDLKTVMMTM